MCGIELNPFKMSYKDQSLANSKINGKDALMAVRDAVETAAVVAGDYFLPGSSLLTSKLASNDSQKQLNADGGRLARIAASGAGAYGGNLSNYGKVADFVGGEGTGKAIGESIGGLDLGDALLIGALMNRGGAPAPGDEPQTVQPEAVDYVNAPEQYLPDLSAQSLAALGKKRGRASTVLGGAGGAGDALGNLGSVSGRKTLVGL